MASADCTCCGVPTTVGAPVLVEPEECDCGCFDCDECEECYHDEEPEFVTPVVLCDECTEDGEGCGPGAWHCRCGRACDGSACPGEPLPEWVTASTQQHLGPHFRNGSTSDHVRGSDDGGAV